MSLALIDSHHVRTLTETAVWRLFGACGLSFAGGNLGKVPAQTVCWTLKAKARVGLRASH